MLHHNICICALQGVYVFYLQLLTDMLHLCVYVVFFVIVFTNYGLPLHLVSLVMAPSPGSAALESHPRSKLA